MSPAQPLPIADYFLYITPGWNFTLRLYQPRPTVLDESWKIPKPQPMELLWAHYSSHYHL